MARRHPVRFRSVLRLEQLERRDAPALSGALDPTFGVGGVVIAGIGAGNDYPTSMAIDRLGRILVAGYTESLDFAVARFTSDGSLDQTFGTGGKVITPIGAAED
jgi:uncharacterized delta-60 repeat protein